jgi:primosomal protein N' (replication factor Y)
MAFFPSARILRMDADSVMSRRAYEDKLGRFAAGEFDIMLGTQMVAKGLDFPNVTLVGVLGADQAMYADDFRSFERTFSLLTQVVGRSGRGESPGVALIQTMTPDSAVIRLASAQDYEAFYEEEILARKSLIFPPYCDFCMIGFSGADYARVKAAAGRFLRELKALSAAEYGALNLIVLGPSPAGVPKVSNKYRCKIMIKCKNSKPFREMIAKMLVGFGRNQENKDVTVFVDMNPNNIL